MTTIHSTTKRFVAAFGVAAGAAVAPALLFAGAGTAHADDPCFGELQYSFYCSPGATAPLAPSAPSTAPWDANPFQGPPSTNLWTSLPGCTGGVLEALDGSC
jgi:hypothetical protein